MAYTLAFDVYGTLINTSGVFDKLNSMITDRAEPFMRLWRQKQLEYSFRRGLMGCHTDFSVCTRDALIYVCKTNGINLSKEQQEELMQSYTELPAFSDVKSCLTACHKENYRMYAFSNGSKSAVNHLLEHSEIRSLFDGIVSTEEVQMFKPSPMVYNHFIKAVGSDEADTWLISGNPFDVMGARACGWNAVWVQRSKDNLFDPWDGFNPTATVQSLDELPEILTKS